MFAIDPVINNLIAQARARILAEDLERQRRQKEAEALARLEYERFLQAWLSKVIHLIPEGLRPYIEHGAGMTPFRFLCPAFKAGMPGNSSKETLMIRAPQLCPLQITFICQASGEWQIHEMINVLMPDGSAHTVQGLDRAIVAAADNYAPQIIQEAEFV